MWHLEHFPGLEPKFPPFLQPSILETHDEKAENPTNRSGRPTSPPTAADGFCRRYGSSCVPSVRTARLTADARASTQACRPKTCKLASHLPLREAVANKLQQDWSPQQVSGWLQKFYGDDSSMQLSHEAIYRSLFIQTRGLLKRELLAHLRSRRMMRRSQAFSTKGRPRGQIIDAVSIHDRPASVEDRAIPGHWEGDLITGSCNSHIATLVERHSRFVVLVKLKGKDTTSVVDALTAQVQELPKELMRTLTWDRGSELAQHKRFTLATNVQVYFCDPRSPWQRGSNENTNGLLRQYFPKGINLSIYTQEQLNEVASKLNGRPRKTLGYDCPADTLNAALQ